jgi:L-ribulose-5-phosphate 3-epimerase
MEDSMSHSPLLSRRQFISDGAAAAAAGAVALSSLAKNSPAFAAEAPYPRLKKAVKFGMIKGNGTIEEKFGLIKSLGFHGVEFDSPANFNRDDAVAARDKTGIEIHGVVDSIHWNTRLSDPDPAVRAKGLEGLHTAIKDCRTLGGSTVLLVPGKVSNDATENFNQVWQRSTAEIRKAIPWAKEKDVKIAIEVVWNDFITTPQMFVKYIDQFNDPTVGGYFDVSNMVKYGVPPADWIRALGPRMLKFDFKGYSRTKEWVNIGEGDENWPDVIKALGEIKYDGWATAEVNAGGVQHLADISARMDRVLGLKS